jgi:hypothetical protein
LKELADLSRGRQFFIARPRRFGMTAEEAFDEIVRFRDA